jgi:hypothetical protein
VIENGTRLRSDSVTELFGSWVLNRHACSSVKPTFTVCVPVTYDADARTFIWSLRL